MIIDSVNGRSRATCHLLFLERFLIKTTKSGVSLSRRDKGLPQGKDGPVPTHCASVSSFRPHFSDGGVPVWGVRRKNRRRDELFI